MIWIREEELKTMAVAMERKRLRKYVGRAGHSGACL